MLVELALIHEFVERPSPKEEGGICMNLKLGFGEGAAILTLLPFVLALLGIGNLLGSLTLVIILNGLWIIVNAFIQKSKRDRMHLLSWGLVVAAISSIFIAPFQYTIALVLIAVIISVLMNVFTRSEPKLPQDDGFTDRPV